MFKRNSHSIPIHVSVGRRLMAWSKVPHIVIVSDLKGDKANRELKFVARTILRDRYPDAFITHKKPGVVFVCDPKGVIDTEAMKAIKGRILTLGPNADILISRTRPSGTLGL